MLTGVKVTAIVSAAKRIKDSGDEPTYSAVVAARPKATHNPATGEAVDKSALYAVFRESCYDISPDDPWGHMNRLARSPLTDTMIKRRWDFTKHMLALKKNTGNNPYEPYSSL